MVKSRYIRAFFSLSICYCLYDAKNICANDAAFEPLHYYNETHHNEKHYHSTTQEQLHSKLLAEYIKQIESIKDPKELLSYIIEKTGKHANDKKILDEFFDYCFKKTGSERGVGEGEIDPLADALLGIIIMHTENKIVLKATAPYLRIFPPDYIFEMLVTYYNHEYIMKLISPHFKRFDEKTMLYLLYNHYDNEKIMDAISPYVVELVYKEKIKIFVEWTYLAIIIWKLFIRFVL